MNSNGQPRKRETTDAHADVSRHPETDEAEASAQKCTQVSEDLLLLLLLHLFFSVPCISRGTKHSHASGRRVSFSKASSLAVQTGVEGIFCIVCWKNITMSCLS